MTTVLHYVVAYLLVAGAASLFVLSLCLIAADAERQAEKKLQSHKQKARAATPAPSIQSHEEGSP